MSRGFHGGTATGAPEGRMVGYVACQSCPTYRNFFAVQRDLEQNPPRLTEEGRAARQEEEKELYRHLYAIPLPEGWLHLEYDLRRLAWHGDFCSAHCLKLFAAKLEKGKIP